MSFLSNYYFPPVHFWTLWFSEAMLCYLNENGYKLKKEDSVLDIGCGLGYHCNTLASMRLKSVSGCDISNDTMKLLNEFPTSINFFKLNICEDDVAKYKHSFDVIFSSDVYEHVIDPQLMLNNIAFILKSDGRICLTFPNWENHGRNQLESKEVLIAQLTEAGFHKIHIEVMKNYSFHFRIFMSLYKFIQKLSDVLMGIKRKDVKGTSMPESDEFHEMYAFTKIQKLKKHKLLCSLINLNYDILKHILRFSSPYILNKNTEKVFNERILLYAEK